jgi:hypothetical protein
MAGLVAVAQAEPVELTLGAGSNIAFEATLNTPVGSDTDSDSSPIAGSITIELDSYGNPTNITLHDYTATVSEALALNFDLGFFGSIDVNVPSASAAYATPGKSTGPVTVENDTTFLFPAVQTNLNGTGTATGNILAIGAINETINLADFNPFITDFAGSVSVTDGVVTLAGTIAFEGSGEVLTGVTMNMSGTLTIEATGDAPASCVADWNGDGVLNFFDVQQYLGAFSSMNPDADLVDDDVFNFFDVQTFLGLFSVGCP